MAGFASGVPGTCSLDSPLLSNKLFNWGAGALSAYWKDKGWLDPGADYFMPHVKGSVVKSLMPRFIAWIAGRSMDKRLGRIESSWKQD